MITKANLKYSVSVSAPTGASDASILTWFTTGYYNNDILTNASPRPVTKLKDCPLHLSQHFRTGLKPPLRPEHLLRIPPVLLIGMAISGRV